MSRQRSLLQRVKHARLHTLRRQLLDAHVCGNLIRGLESHAVNVRRETVGILLQHLDGLRAIRFVDAQCARRADAALVQEDHDVVDRLLLQPRLANLLPALLAHALDLLESGGFVFDDLKHLAAEVIDDALGVLFADAIDQAAAEVAHQAVE
jgi:hypothetical protein